MGDTFEPNTLGMLSSMVDRDSHVMDIGANIGFTAIALSGFCPGRKVTAVEPAPRTFSLFEQNVKAAHATKESCSNFTLGSEAGELPMQGNSNFLTVFEHRASELEKVVSAKEQLIWHI